MFWGRPTSSRKARGPLSCSLCGWSNASASSRYLASCSWSGSPVLFQLASLGATGRHSGLLVGIANAAESGQQPAPGAGTPRGGIPLAWCGSPPAAGPPARNRVPSLTVVPPGWHVVQRFQPCSSGPRFCKSHDQRGQAQSLNVV